MIPIALFQTIGFSIEEPEFMLGSLSEDDLYGLPYMEMGESYKDTDSIISVQFIYKSRSTLSAAFLLAKQSFILRYA